MTKNDSGICNRTKCPEGLEDNSQIKLALYFSPELQVTASEPITGRNLYFLVQYQYLKNNFIHFYVGDKDFSDGSFYYSHHLSTFPAIRTWKNPNGVSVAIGINENGFGSDAFFIQSESKVIIFYNDL